MTYHCQFTLQSLLTSSVCERTNRNCHKVFMEGYFFIENCKSRKSFHCIFPMFQLTKNIKGRSSNKCKVELGESMYCSVVFKYRQSDTGVSIRIVWHIVSICDLGLNFSVSVFLFLLQWLLLCTMLYSPEPGFIALYLILILQAVASSQKLLIEWREHREAKN